MRDMTSPWTEIGDRVFVRRYAVFDQDIVAVLGHGDEALILDTRSTYRQAREVLDDLRALGSPRVAAVVNSHGHFDHALGNRVFRPAPIWGHVRCAVMLDPATSTQLELAASELDPDDAADLGEVQLDPPDRVFADRATLEVGGRLVELDYLGRGHTDNDIILVVPDADVLCAGDLLENGASPYFGDAFPMDWPATLEALLGRTGPSTVVVPGHGDHAGRAFVEASLAEVRAIAALATRVHAGSLDLDAAVAAAPYPPEDAVEPLERALAQLRGELEPGAGSIRTAAPAPGAPAPGRR
jgi:glyoxylase-like metal-dependent hydrolase (beta-lactamase superfamily II)